MSSLYTKVWFSFGEDPGAYFFWGPSGYTFSQIPTKLANEFNKHGIRRVYYLSLGAENVALAAWETADGGWRKYTSGRISNYGSLESQLVEWRSKEGWRLSVCLAANGNYVACETNTGASQWHEDHRPEDFGKWMRHYSGVEHVALGYGGDWVLISKSGNSTVWSYKCKENHPALGAILDDLESGEEVTFIALNPWRPNQFFLVINHNTAYYSVDACLNSRISEILRENNIRDMGTVRYSPVQTTTKYDPNTTANNNVPRIRSKSEDFWQQMVGHAVEAATGVVVTAVVSSCSVM